MSFTQWKQHGCQIIGWTLKDTYDRLSVAFFYSICWTNHCLEFWGFFVTFVAIYFDVISPSWFKIMSIVKCHLKQLKDVEQLFWSVLTSCSMLIVSLGFVMCKMWCESFRGLRNILKAVALIQLAVFLRCYPTLFPLILSLSWMPTSFPSNVGAHGCFASRGITVSM